MAVRERFPALEKYRAALLAHWEGVCAALEEVWARLPAHRRERASSIIAELLEFERAEVLPSLAKLLGRPIALPERGGLDGYCALRASEIAVTRALTPEEWSLQERHPRFGIRTTQWWVERSLIAAKAALEQLRTIVG